MCLVIISTTRAHEMISITLTVCDYYPIHIIVRYSRHGCTHTAATAAHIQLPLHHTYSCHCSTHTAATAAHIQLPLQYTYSCHCCTHTTATAAHIQPPLLHTYSCHCCTHTTATAAHIQPPLLHTYNRHWYCWLYGTLMSKDFSRAPNHHTN